MTAAATAGSPEPLGATPLEGGVNFAVWSAHAEAVEVCLYDDAGETETARIRLPERTGEVFHGFVPGIGAGARYGLRVHGPFAPDAGHRFNPHKLLVDPYAQRIDRAFSLHPSMFGYRPEAPDGGRSFDTTDSGPFVPKAVVLPPAAPGVRAPVVPWADTVVYEMHVRGFSMRHPALDADIKGTFAALATPAAIGHFQALGITTLEVMPAAAWIDERHLGPLGLTNYWGYNPAALLAPDPRLAPGGWEEIAAATAVLADAGIEVVLDVVFNHTGEGDHLGPTVSLKGIDNAGYYRLGANGRYVDDSGCGDTLALDRPAGLRLALEAMRTWARRGGISGFRLDLATSLARRDDGFDSHAPFLGAVAQDPELSGLKIVAEPWDCGPGGYRLGAFPGGWGEWNDRFRDGARRFWRGDAGVMGEFASRLSGSADLIGSKRRPSRSVNFVVAHDGFTLADLVSYAAKHNQANGEDNRDGNSHEPAWNHGVEGPTDDADIAARRLADQRALLASLLLARGTPMLASGMELGQTQGGNNNAYAQDNAIAWLDWARDDDGLAAFTAQLIRLRKDHPALRADRFLTGRPVGDSVYPDVEWRSPDGPMQPGDWNNPAAVALAMVLADPEGDARAPGRVALVFHRGDVPVRLVLPTCHEGHGWRTVLDTAGERAAVFEGPQIEAHPRSVLLLEEAPHPVAARSGAAPELLATLAAAAGIAHDWWTVDGACHLVSPDTQTALLASMRLPAGSNAEARDSLRRLSEGRERRSLPPVAVGREGASLTVDLALDPGAPDRPTALLLVDKSGVETPVVSDTSAEDFVGLDGRLARRRRLTLSGLPVGRHRLIREDAPDAPCAVTVAPRSCHLPPLLANGGRAFGVTAQLYSLQRAEDQGIGDFTALARLAEAAAAAGAATVGLNPLHALFPADAERASPYHPSDRRFLNPLYLDLPEAGAPPPSERVDYPRVAAAKQAALEARFAHFAGDADFDRFVAEGGEALARFAAFQAIAEHHPRQPWQAWPEPLRDAHGPGVADFARAHSGRVRFHQYVQWLCDRQLAQAARAGKLPLGLYLDLAVGAAPDGAEAWSGQDGLCWGASVGAPPDPLGPDGQVWSLPPPDPHRWRAEGYSTFAGLVRASMRHAGALRIDHVMGLARLFCVPEGARGDEGAYVAYPLHDLLGELALESTRAGCLIVGEDLGTVPHGLREALAENHILSYRVLAFERQGNAFAPPAHYPRAAVACAASHDLPTLAGWWEGADIDERLHLGLFDEAAAAQARLDREADKAALLDAIVAAGGLDSAEFRSLDDGLAAAIHAYVAATPSMLALVQADDLGAETVGVNLPGTDRERPNWRRRIALPVPELMSTPRAEVILGAVRHLRAPKN
jgi:glycogen operon protein